MFKSKYTLQFQAASVVPQHSYFLSKYIYTGLEIVRGTLRDFNVPAYETDTSYSLNTYIVCL
jgi:hypothetical protein